ncbi:MAG: guanosine polyphosphate pyrophosphohydrolase [Lachnospiraceae bacterium]|nr:guanosine polyphosphate pyrophosphohydrolase [Lachnospiraceae bacterium]
MILLNDYLFSGDTVLKILQKYSADLKQSALDNHNPIDMVHCNFLLQQIDILEHNDFLTSQSQRIRELYKLMAGEYPFLAFTFKGRIKSLIRAEEKFNGYIVEYVYDYYKKNNEFPSLDNLKQKLNCFRDLIAYRIVISMPQCHIKEGDNRNEIELDYLYKVANILPEFLEERGFSVQISEKEGASASKRLDPNLKKYFRDYIENPSPIGYQSLHITLYDNIARSYIEVQLRTKEMDDYAEIGPANHLGYEKRQEEERTRRDEIPNGAYPAFDEAYERLAKLHALDLSEVNVNMFGAISNSVVNDGCGLFRGRLILPYEHLSRFQNDIID